MTTFPYGYAGDPAGMGTMLTRAQLEAKQTVSKLNSEFWRRFIAMCEFAATRGVPLGVGTGWRVQPNPPPAGFAKPGNSNHEGFPADGVSGGAVAIDTVPAPSWPWMEANCAAFGLRTFKNVNDEPWHVQPSDIPAGRSGRTEPWNLQTWDLPGPKPEPPEPPKPEPEPEEEDMPATLLKSSNGTEDQKNTTFWWDGRQIGQVRTKNQINVGKVMGHYKGDDNGEALKNFTADDIQKMIDSSWAGGPTPSGWKPPKAGAVDSGTG